MPESAYVPLIAAAVTGVVALLAAYLTNRSNTYRLKLQFEAEDRRKRAEMLRARGEELYGLSEQRVNALTGRYLGRRRVMLDHITMDQALDLELESMSKPQPEYVRIEMLVHVYFPATEPALKALIEARDHVERVVSDHHRAYECNGPLEGPQFLEPLQQAWSQFESAASAFKREVIRCIREA